METEDEGRARLENDAATKRLRLDRRRKKSKTDEDGSYHTAQVAWKQRMKEVQKNGLNLIWI